MNQPDKRSARDRCRISSSKCAVCPVPRVCKMFIFIYMMVQLVVFLLHRTADRNKETKKGVHNNHLKILAFGNIIPCVFSVNNNKNMQMPVGGGILHRSIYGRVEVLYI